MDWARIERCDERHSGQHHLARRFHGDPAVRARRAAVGRTTRMAVWTGDRLRCADDEPLARRAVGAHREWPDDGVAAQRSASVLRPHRLDLDWVGTLSGWRPD